MYIHKNVPEYNLAMGECKMQLKQYKDAVAYFGIVVHQKPKNKAGWEALIGCLIEANYFEEAIEQCKAAIKATDNKAIFIFYYSAILFYVGKNKCKKFESDSACIAYYKSWQDKRYSKWKKKYPKEDYYHFLKYVKYATGDKYTAELKPKVAWVQKNLKL